MCLSTLSTLLGPPICHSDALRLDTAAPVWGSVRSAAGSGSGQRVSGRGMYSYFPLHYDCAVGQWSLPKICFLSA